MELMGTDFPPFGTCSDESCVSEKWDLTEAFFGHQDQILQSLSNKTYNLNSTKHDQIKSSTKLKKPRLKEQEEESFTGLKAMIYWNAAIRPLKVGALEEAVEKPKRKNVKISSDPQTAAARQRRERISQRLRVLQRLVPGGTKLDTASMLDEAASYLKFLKSLVSVMESHGDLCEISSLVLSLPSNISFSCECQCQAADLCCHN